MKGKRPIRDGARPPETPKLCDHPDCEAEALYRAPRSRDALGSYYFFCLDHVRAYNARWDFCKDMKPDEIEAMIRNDLIGNRPTWPLGRLGSGAKRRQARGEGFFAEEDWIDPLGILGKSPKRPGPSKRKKSPEEEALALFDLDWPVTVAKLKARYKELVKRHHPDINGGSKTAEEKLKTIIAAYKTLLNSLNTVKSRA